MSNIHNRIVHIKNVLVPVVDRIPYARRLSTPVYVLTKKYYKKINRRSSIPIENNATDDKTVPQYYRNDNLVDATAEHLARIHNRKLLYYEPESTGFYKPHENDPRLIAIYLPQFHKVPLNENSWGKGFTEWTNVASATPAYIGHQQPILPEDLGFYDLDRDEKIKEQIELAKKYGINGFMFYYYWFSGEKVLNRPIETFLKNKEWNFNFMICWANENWTKRWDGMDNEIIIGQKYKDNDALDFIKEVSPILNDHRYITIDGVRPILSVYRPSTISNIEEYSSIWRKYFKEKYGKDLYLIVGNNHTDDDPRNYGFDALYDFSPGSVLWGGSSSELANIKEENYESIKLDINFKGSLVDYRKIALNSRLDAAERYDFPAFQTVFPHWDNHARKKGRDTHAITNSNPEIYAFWLDRVIQKSLANQKYPIVFINAWNEWAEGAMLEPTLHLGHANLIKTAEILSKYSHNEKNKLEFPLSTMSSSENTKIAVIIHLFYPELWDILTEKLKNISQDFDIYVTVPEKHSGLKLKYGNHKIMTFVVPNWGRDILPFLHVMRKIKYGNYNYVLKLHSKKSKHHSRTHAMKWLKYTIDSLLHDSDSTDNIISSLGDNIRIIGAKDFAVKMSKGGDKELINRLNKYYEKTDAKNIINNLDDYMFSAGSMFWAKIEAFDSILDRYIVADDFELEYGQLWNTMAHFIERDIWINIKTKFGNKSIAFVSRNGEICSAESMHEAPQDTDFPKLLSAIEEDALLPTRKPKVSILITNYNYGKYIGKAITSAIRQTHNNLEIIIIDDGSTDGISQKEIKKYTSKYPNRIISYMRNHQGIVPVRNFCLSKCSGEFLIFLDADDILPVNYVEKMLEDAITGNYDVVYADIHNFGASHKIQLMPEFNKFQMLRYNIVNMSALIRTSSIGRQKFDNNLNNKKFEDWDFFLGMMLAGAKFSKCHNTFLKYRVHPGQRNNNLNRDKEFWDEYTKTIDYIRNKYSEKYTDIDFRQQ